MKLELENGDTFLDPDDKTLATTLTRLNQYNSFAILSASNMVYLQTAINADGSFVLEYQAGSLQAHYQATTDLALAQVVAAFQWYAKNDMRWQAVCAWQKLTL